MREIKFRAWSMTQKRMYDRVLAGPGDPCSLVWVEERRDWFNFDNASGVIMQYTGLKDKNGREIFEGDICRMQDGYPPRNSYEVYWNDDRWGLRDKEGGDYDNGDYYHGDVISWPEAEIIGNIYEHPEVLK